MTPSENRYIIQSPPAPWKRLPGWAVGGLFQIGYAENSDLLLVLSTQGRGIFDCITGEKIARDYEDAEGCFDKIRLLAQGFGPLEGGTIRMAGLFGGGLPLTTEDNWALEVEAPEWPNHTVLLSSPSIRNPDESVKYAEEVAIGNTGACELRAFGFSETGRSLVIATSCALEMFAR